MAIEQILSFELIKIEQSQYCSVSDKTVIKQSVHMWRVNIYRREADTSGSAGPGPDTETVSACDSRQGGPLQQLAHF